MHLGIIPDGNRRFCAERGVGLEELSGIWRSMAEEMLSGLAALWTGEALSGHGGEELRALLEVDRYTVYVLSTDNLCRSDASVGAVFAFLDAMLSDGRGSDSVSMAAGRFLARFPEGVRLEVVGDTGVLPPAVAEKLRAARRRCSTGRIVVTLAIGYDGLRDCEGAYSHDTPPMDAVFRTGRERRLSGFFPLHTMHSELVFSDKLWPEVTLRDLAAAVEEYRTRERRMGL